KTHKAWTTILRTTDQAVTDNAAAGYTTLGCFCFVEYSIFGASVGDSDLVQLNSREPAKILTAWQHKAPLIGSCAAIPVAFTSDAVYPWKSLALTDGVWKYVGWQDVFKIASEYRGQEMIGALLERARLKQSRQLQDDFTILFLES